MEKPGHQSEAVEQSQSRPKMPRHGHWRKGVFAMAVFALLVTAGYFARDFFKRLGPPDRCWEIKEVDGHLYKTNPCTGQFLLLGDAPATTPDR